MNRLALMTGILSLTLASVAAEAQTQPQAGAQPTVPGSTYDATQQRSQTQPGQQPKLYQHQNQPQAVTTAPAPASGLGAVGTMTGATSPYQGGAAPAYRAQPVQAQPGFASAAPASGPELTQEIQSELTTAGYEPGPIDGIAGPRTKKAIRAYQADSGMAQDGAASPEVLSQLRAKRMQAVAPAAGQPQIQPPRPAPMQPQPAPVASSAPPPSSTQTEESSGGFFSGWFKRMDDDSAVNKEVQPGNQPKFHRDNTASQESHGPGITYPWPAQASGPTDPAALNRVAPAAGAPVQ